MVISFSSLILRPVTATNIVLNFLQNHHVTPIPAKTTRNVWKRQMESLNVFVQKSSPDHDVKVSTTFAYIAIYEISLGDATDLPIKTKAIIWSLKFTTKNYTLFQAFENRMQQSCGDKSVKQTDLAVITFVKIYRRDRIFKE